MNGQGDRATDKWGSISNLMRTRKVAVLALQETHPTTELQEAVERRFRNTLRVFHSADPVNPSTTGGVSVVVNKSLVAAGTVEHRTILHGRVMIVDVPWNEHDTLRVMNVYAPARNQEKADFWEELLEKIENDESLRPDILLGDLNVVENPEIDRLNNRGTDPVAARNALSELVTELNLTDGWRRRNPTKRGFTFTANGHSRLDRIYSKEDIYPWCTDWRIEHPGFRTDHSLVSVQLTSENMPFIGRGRWAIPANLLRNRELKRQTQLLAKQMQDEIQGVELVEPPAGGPQVILKSFKTRVVELYRNHQRTHQPKLTKTIERLQRELQDKADTPGLSEDDIREQTALLTERIDTLEGKRRDQKRLLGSARNRLESETLSRHWVRSATESAPRNTIRALRNPLGDPGHRETRSDGMARMARDYHEKLLSADRDPNTAPDREKLGQVLRNIGARLPPDGVERLQGSLSEAEVAAALTASANYKAAGLDGVPMELWKLLHQQYKSAGRGNRHRFCNIAWVLTRVFNDISENGIAEGTNFNEGWMCPIYKKKEADNIANYRPITLLNTDYKVFTKVIATRLTDVAPSIIHPDQAGFIRGRSIFDQIEQAATTINYARLKGLNGAIVALDQEKAYDKILHPYLWRVLEEFAFPAKMIDMIKTLYGDAPTSVMINGMVSDPFLVTRGVRQGDPMSCILFNLGIEPLAANIRASSIRGLEVPNLSERIKVSLFADDTTIILTEHDSFAELTGILDEWCRVSGAKFNVEKTEIIPIGSEEYRRKLVETRKMNEVSGIIPPPIHIARDGSATRLLGAWIGNGVSPEEPWGRITETIKKDFKRWESRYPTLEGKRHIVQMIAGGKTQFLTRAQGMPDTVRKSIQKAITGFLWGKDRATMRIESMAEDVEQGGRKMLDLVARNEAIDLMWVKQYLNMGADRPKWAYMVDEIFRSERPKSSKEAAEIVANWNPLTQGWKPKARSACIPKRVQNALRLADKHGVELEALEPSEETKREMPVWLHRKANKEAARIYASDAVKCLKNRHRTHYIKQLEGMVLGAPSSHRETNFCACDSCRRASELGCTHPNKCLATAKGLLNALAPEWRPGTQRRQPAQGQRPAAATPEAQRGRVEVRSAGDPTDLKDSIRIFTNRGVVTEAEVTQERRGEAHPESELVVYTDGSCEHNGTADARAGSGVWYGANDPRNAAIRVPGDRQTNQVGELLAILHVAKTTPSDQPLRVCSDSKFAIDGLTKHAPGWEAKDWIGVAHGPLFKCTTAWLRARTGETNLQWVKGHAGIEGNEEADRLAAEGARKDPSEGEIDLRVPAGTVTTGAKLAQTGQNLIYHYLKGAGGAKRVATRRTIERIKTAAKENFGETPTEAAIWKSMRHKDITKKVRDFLWKHAHGIYRLGNAWSHIPGCENRATCPRCNEQDTFEHILMDCDSTERRVAWDRANTLWKRRYAEDLPITAGAVLGGGLASFRRPDGRLDTAKNRLYRILVTETAHVIWVLRCERRITNSDDPGHQHTEDAVGNRWHRRINERMQIDCLLTNTFLYERKALGTKKVYATWASCSTSTETFHREWCRHPGFLVVKTSDRPPGTTQACHRAHLPTSVPHWPA